MTLTQEQLSKKLIGLKLQLPKRYHDSIRELIDTDAALRARLEAVEGDYEAAQHLADTTGGAWKLCKHDVDVAREQLAKVEVELERDRWMEDKPLSGVIVKLEERLAAAEGRVRELEQKLRLEQFMNANGQLLLDETQTRVQRLEEALQWHKVGEQFLKREVFGYVNGSWGCKDPKKYLRNQLDRWLAQEPKALTPAAAQEE